MNIFKVKLTEVSRQFWSLRPSWLVSSVKAASVAAAGDNIPSRDLWGTDADDVMVGAMSAKKSNEFGELLLLPAPWRTFICFTSNSAPSGSFDKVLRLWLKVWLAEGLSAVTVDLRSSPVNNPPLPDAVGDCNGVGGVLALWLVGTTRSCGRDCGSTLPFNFIADDWRLPTAVLALLTLRLSTRNWSESLTLASCVKSTAWWPLSNGPLTHSVEWVDLPSSEVKQPASLQSGESTAVKYSPRSRSRSDLLEVKRSFVWDRTWFLTLETVRCSPSSAVTQSKQSKQCGYKMFCFQFKSAAIFRSHTFRLCLTHPFSRKSRLGWITNVDLRQVLQQNFDTAFPVVQSPSRSAIIMKICHVTQQAKNPPS